MEAIFSEIESRFCRLLGQLQSCHTTGSMPDTVTANTDCMIVEQEVQAFLSESFSLRKLQFMSQTSAVIF